MNKKFLNTSKYLISILVIIIFAFACINKNFENDLFFDIKTGQSILKYGLDFKDHFSFIPNLTYIYLHWIYDLFIFFVYNFGGWNGVFSFFLLVFSIFGLTVFFVNTNYTNKITSVFIALITIFMSSYAFQTRVQSITYLLFFIEIYLLEKLYVKGEKKYLFFLMAISILIVNIHMPLWLLYLIFCLPFVSEIAFYKLSTKINILNNFFSAEKPKNAKLFLITFFILIFTGLISPLKLHPYTFFTKTLFDSTYLFIGEMNKTVLFYYISEIILLLLIFIGMFTKTVKYKFRDFLITVGLFVFSLIAVRNVVFFLIITPTLYVKNFYTEYKFRFNKFSSISKKINFNVVSIFTIISLIIIYVSMFFSLYNKSFDYNIKNNYPDKIVNYIRKNFDYNNLKIYADYGYGSYIEFYNLPSFIDSRSEVYNNKFNNSYNILNDYISIKQFNKYKKIFQKYDFDLAIVPTKGNLYYYLKSDPDYKKIFQEKEATDYTLFKKSTNFKSK